MDKDIFKAHFKVTNIVVCYIRIFTVFTTYQLGGRKEHFMIPYKLLWGHLKNYYSEGMQSSTSSGIDYIYPYSKVEYI